VFEKVSQTLGDGKLLLGRLERLQIRDQFLP
jgi:hypothetical protein